jgi:hypothetical protein
MVPGTGTGSTVRDVSEEFDWRFFSGFDDLELVVHLNVSYYDAMSH